jgi:hypothetical protein
LEVEEDLGGEETCPPEVGGVEERGAVEATAVGGSDGEDGMFILFRSPAKGGVEADEATGGMLGSIGFGVGWGSGKAATAGALEAGGIAIGFSVEGEGALPEGSAAGREFCGSAEAETGSRIVLACCTALCASTSLPT